MEVRNQINIVAPKDAWVLITGENGTGKEMVARTIHHLSARSEHPMITVNCASIPKKFMESELFGHEKGAFPGAKQRKRGRFELANQGTLFFDEAADMDLETQASILRVLESQQFQRVGGGRTITVDVRVIASTNKNLEEEIAKGNFREDLYYRLNVVPIAMPPLKERAQDIPSLCEEFFKEFAADNQNEPKTISQNALEALMRYPWPGNVRELRNLVERLVISTKASHVDIRHIPPVYKECLPGTAVDFGLDVFDVDSYKDAKKAFETAYVQRQLARRDNDLEATAKAIGMDKSAMKKILKNVK